MTGIDMRVEPPWDDGPREKFDIVAGKGKKPRKYPKHGLGIRYVCSRCGKDCGTSPGAKGMLTMHIKNKHNGGKE